MSKVKHATIKGLTGKEVDSVLDKAQELLAGDTDNMNGTECYSWKEAAYTLLTENGNNWINLDFSFNPFKTELTRLVRQCEEAILTRTVARENQEAAASSHLIFNLLNKQQEEEEMIINKEVATSKEEAVTPVQEGEKEMTVSELTNLLVAQGVSLEVAEKTALQVAKEKAQESQPLEIEQRVSSIKPWFQQAVDNLIVPRKTSLIGQLTIIELASKEETEKAEINAEIERLLDKETGDARFNQLLEGYILEAKGWTLDKTGKVSGIIYSTGDITEKSVSMTVKGLGAATTWTGEKIAKAGDGMQNNAPKVGAAIRKPLDVTANLINGINKKK